MPDPVEERVHAILRARHRHVELSPELALGSGGLALDSVAIVEVLLECEEAFGVAIAADVLAEPSLTVGSLIDALRARVQP